ncbi:MAG: hypothetical protein M3N13_09110 [Candidatus Eremiobacteraeota bacterium]|nr:hypothetical protein [Candidatus Eremiobacteraeota bacterium]
MADEVEAADDYLRHVEDALREAATEIDAAASVPVSDGATKEYLGRALGQARNALSRAERDLAAHVGRRIRHDAERSADRYISNLRLVEASNAEVVIAVIPLPLENERIPLELISRGAFHTDFTNWVTRFNHDERSTIRLPYLMEVPGNLSPVFEREQFRFLSYAQGAKEPSQAATLYQSGAFVFRHRLYSWQTPPRYTIGYVSQDLRSTMLFVLRLYEDLHIAPRSLAIQSALANVSNFRLMTPTGFGGEFGGFNELEPKEGLVSIVAPERPLVVPYTRQQAVVDQIISRTEASVLSHYRPSAPSREPKG